jgi:hypothetical protein
MFFFRPGSNFCILRAERIAHRSKDLVSLDAARYLSTVHLVLTWDFGSRAGCAIVRKQVRFANHCIQTK